MTQSPDTREHLTTLLLRGNALLGQYERQHDSQWAAPVLSSGTVADRVAALTLLAENEPLVCLRPLDALLSLAYTEKRREMQMAVESLQHTFCRLLPRNRRLLRFDAQAGACEGSASSAQLMSWAFEAGLKKRYKAFVGLLERGSSDRVFYIKRLCVRASFEMLCARPEQEQALLAVVVNKLGDPEPRICSMVVHLLLQLATQHPAMKYVMFREVERLLFRPNATRAACNCIGFLNRIKLRRGHDGRFANLLVHTYFELFSRGVAGECPKADRTGEMRRQRISPRNAPQTNRGLGMILIGINRALPYTDQKGGRGVWATKTDPLFRMVEAGDFNIAVQALAVLVQIVRFSDVSASDPGCAPVGARFYRGLVCKIGDPGLIHSSKRALFFNILYRTVKDEPTKDRNRRLKQHLFRVSAFADSAFAAGALFLQAKTQMMEMNVQLSFWELYIFLRHFHPSVRKLAHLLATNRAKISYSGDPLQDLQAASFLDGFFKKGPKRLVNNR